MTVFITILSILYAGVGIASLIAYIPTIKDLWHHEKPSANTSSYAIWTATSLVAFLYSIFVVPDFLFQAVSTVNLVCCGLIFVLMLKLDRDEKKAKK
jgi:hypothetical protein